MLMVSWPAIPVFIRMHYQFRSWLSTRHLSWPISVLRYCSFLHKGPGQLPEFVLFCVGKDFRKRFAQTPSDVYFVQESIYCCMKDQICSDFKAYSEAYFVILGVTSSIHEASPWCKHTCSCQEFIQPTGTWYTYYWGTGHEQGIDIIVIDLRIVFLRKLWNCIKLRVTPVDLEFALNCFWVFWLLYCLF